MCFHETIKDFVYPLERRKIRSKNERRKNTNSQLFNGVLSGLQSGLGLLSSQSLLENSLGVDFMYQLSEKFMKCSALPKAVRRHTEGQKGCWTSHFAIQRTCEYNQEVYLYFRLKQRQRGAHWGQRQFLALGLPTRAMVHKDAPNWVIMYGKDVF